MILEKELNIIKDYNNGMVVKEISNKYYYHIKTIYSVLKKYNIKLVQWKKCFKKNQINEMIELYKSGETIEYIALYMKSSYHTIRRILVENKITIKKVGGSKPMPMPSKKRLVYLLDNYNKKEIAYMYYVCVQTVNKWIKKHNIKYLKHYISDEEFIKKYYKYYYNTKNNLHTFAYVIGFSYEYIRRRQNRLNLPRKDKRKTFKVYNEIDVKKRCL